MDIYLLKGGDRLGPYTPEQISRLYNTGKITDTDLAWDANEVEWLPVTHYLGRVTPPPAPSIPTANIGRSIAHENDLWRGRPSLFNYLGSSLMAIVFVVVGIIFCLSEDMAVVGLFCIWIGISIPVLILIDRARRRYFVTSRRVMIEVGILIKSTREVRIQDIRSVNVARRGFGGLMGIGTVEFSSAARDDADVIFKGISNAEGVRKMVNVLQQ